MKYALVSRPSDAGFNASSRVRSGEMTALTDRKKYESRKPPANAG